MSDMIGRELEGYRIEAELGRGGQAVVYRATQLSLQRTVALKVVSPQLSSDSNFKERFTREGIAAASLDHPHVIPVFEAGEADGLAFLAMKFIDGPSLDAVVHAPGGVAPRRTLSVLRQVAEALDYVAAQGLVHRDVKPANVLLGPGDHAYLSDFGLIKAISAARLTSPGTWMGTLEYVAPEQIRGGAITPAADRYALGAMAFEALTGQTLFPREDRTATLFAHVNDEPPAASGLNPNFGPAVDAAFARALAKDPAARHPSAVDFVDELTAAVTASADAADLLPPLAAAVPPPPPPRAAVATPAAPKETTAAPATVTGEPSDGGATITPAAPTRTDEPQPLPPSDRGESGPDRKRLAIVGAIGLAATLAVVLAVMFATGAIGGGRTVTTFVAPTTDTAATVGQTVTGPEGATVGAALPASLPGWTLVPSGSDIGNIPAPPAGIVESAQADDGGRHALIGAIRMPDESQARSAFLRVEASVGGQQGPTPPLGLDPADASEREVIDGTAVIFVRGTVVSLVVAADSNTARELAGLLAAAG